jgi:hypothetical protein
MKVPLMGMAGLRALELRDGIVNWLVYSERAYDVLLHYYSVSYE